MLHPKSVIFILRPAAREIQACKCNSFMHPSNPKPGFSREQLRVIKALRRVFESKRMRREEWILVATDEESCSSKRTSLRTVLGKQVEFFLKNPTEKPSCEEMKEFQGGLLLAIGLWIFIASWGRSQEALREDEAWRWRKTAPLLTWWRISPRFIANHKYPHDIIAITRSSFKRRRLCIIHFPLLQPISFIWRFWKIQWEGENSHTTLKMLCY